MPGKSQQCISTHVSLIAFSAASAFSRASREHVAKNGTFGGPSVWGPHEDRDFFQAVTFLLSQSIRGERGGILGGDLTGPKTEPRMNSRVVFMRMNFEQTGQDLCFSVLKYVDITRSFYSCLMPRPLLLCNVSKAHVWALLKFSFLVPQRWFGRALALCANELEYRTWTKITRGCFDPINYKGTVYTLAQF